MPDNKEPIIDSKLKTLKLVETIPVPYEQVYGFLPYVLVHVQRKNPETPFPFSKVRYGYFDEKTQEWITDFKQFYLDIFLDDDLEYNGFDLQWEYQVFDLQMNLLEKASI